MRASARVRSNLNAIMMSASDCETIFLRYAKSPGEADGGASGAGGGKSGGSGGNKSRATATAQRDRLVLTYELFLAALVHCASRLKRAEVPFLSEGVREYIMRYVKSPPPHCILL